MSWFCRAYVLERRSQYSIHLGTKQANFHPRGVYVLTEERFREKKLALRSKKEEQHRQKEAWIQPYGERMETGALGLGGRVLSMTRGLVYRPELGCASCLGLLWRELTEGYRTHTETHRIQSPDVLSFQCLSGKWSHWFRNPSAVVWAHWQFFCTFSLTVPQWPSAMKVKT